MSAPDRIIAVGLARSRPAYFGAEPWTGSKTAASVPMLALGAVATDHVLDARVEVLGVLSDDDQVDVVVARLDARHRLGGAEVGVQPERLAEPHVDAPEPAPDRGGDRALQADAGPAHRLK